MARVPVQRIFAVALLAMLAVLCLEPVHAHEGIAEHGEKGLDCAVCVALSLELASAAPVLGVESPILQSAEGPVVAVEMVRRRATSHRLGRAPPAA